jgi:hypothetical protein
LIFFYFDRLKSGFSGIESYNFSTVGIEIARSTLIEMPLFLGRRLNALRGFSVIAENRILGIGRAGAFRGLLLPEVMGQTALLPYLSWPEPIKHDRSHGSIGVTELETPSKKLKTQNSGL